MSQPSYIKKVCNADNGICYVYWLALDTQPWQHSLEAILRVVPPSTDSQVGVPLGAGDRENIPHEVRSQRHEGFCYDQQVIVVKHGFIISYKPEYVISPGLGVLQNDVVIILCELHMVHTKAFTWGDHSDFQVKQPWGCTEEL